MILICLPIAQRNPMLHKRKFFWLILFLLIALSACTNLQNSETSGISASQLTPIPRITPSTNPPGPSKTPTVVFSFIGQFDNLQKNTPTPIATPEEPNSEFILKEWSEVDSLNLLKTMHAYSAANHAIMPSPKYDFYLTQQSVRLAAQEFLARFADSVYEKDVRWRLAFANTLLSDSSSDEWIVNQIEKGLNDGSILMSNLDQALVPYGFQIETLVADPTAYPFLCGGKVSPISVLGLFDARNVQIWEIHAIDEGTGLVIAVIKELGGYIKVVPIHSGEVRWGDGVCQTVKLQDLTGDDVPEIIIAEGYASGSMQADEVTIYQRKNDGFVRIFTTRIFDLPYIVTFSEKSDIQKSIRIQYDLDTYRFSDVWLWDTEQFRYSSTQIVFPIKPEEIYFNVLHAAMETGQYSDLETQLKQMEYPVDLVGQKGPALKDYLTFELAMSQALLFKYKEAQATLESIVDTSAHPELSVMTDAARRFLDVYHSEYDLYRGCQAVQSFYQGFPVEATSENKSQSNPANPESLLDFLDLCDPQIMLFELLNTISFRSSDDIAEKVNDYGVELLFRQTMDINEDGVLDWLLIPDYRVDDDLFLWIFTSQNGNYQVDSIPFFNPDETLSAVHIELVHLPKDERLSLLFAVNDSLKLARWEFVDGKINFKTIPMDYFINEYQVHQDDTSFSVEMKSNLKYSFGLNSYRQILEWDSEKEQFSAQDYYEKMILTSDQRQTVIPELSNTINQLIIRSKNEEDLGWAISRMQYLLGLAYELSGDREKAAQTYYDLWQAYPDLPYAVMAREKLQPIYP